MPENKLTKLDELFRMFQKRIFNIRSRLLQFKKDIRKRKDKKRIEEIRKNLKSS